jgi:hypothetical protein
MHARALRLALQLLTTACATAALGSMTGCPLFFSCPEPWSDPTLLELGTSADLIGVGPGVDYDDVVALGLGGLVAHHDGEQATTQSPVNVALRASTRRDGRLIVVGDQGSVLVSDDAGASWSPRSSGTTTSLTAIMRANLGGVDSLVAVGVEVIVVSLDGGETWAVGEPPATGWGTLRGLFLTSERIYAVGDAGVAWSSATPEGLWNAEELGTTANLLGGGSSYAAGDATVGEGETLLVIASDNTLLLRDANGWSSRPLTLDGSAIAFSGGYVLTSSGAIYDLDGTGSAALVPVDLPFEATALYGDGSGIVLVGREGGAARIYFQPCIGGRPFVIAGERVRASVAGECEAADPRWLAAARDEHASIASFAVHVAELASLGAPPQLLADAFAALRDEVDHATRCLALAQRQGARAPLQLGPLAISPASLARCGDAREIALALLEQGCVNETLAACEAAVEAASETGEAARVLADIAADERRHAALAWRTLAWLVREHPQVRASLRSRLARLAAQVPASGERAAIHAATLRELIVPLAQHLLRWDDAEAPRRSHAPEA